MADLSKYPLSLDHLDLNRYKEKLTVTVNNTDVLLPDPYNLSSDWFSDPKRLPPTQYPAVYQYLIKTPGRFTREAFDAYKSLDAYNYFSSGLVRDVQQHDIGGNYSFVFVKASVETDQQQPPYNPWICLDKESGHVVSSHCTCTAGLSDVCSHIAALLFAIDNSNRNGSHDTQVYAAVKRIWPDYFKKTVTSTTAENLDVSPPSSKKRKVSKDKLELSSEEKDAANTKKRKARKEYPELSPEEKNAALSDLASILPSAAVVQNL